MAARSGADLDRNVLASGLPRPDAKRELHAVPRLPARAQKRHVDLVIAGARGDHVRLALQELEQVRNEGLIADVDDHGRMG